MESKKKRVWLLFLTFLKIGAFTFGGGYAMIPLISKEVVETHKWITDDDILEIVAIAESTPGPIAINSATFVGYRVAGFWGAFFSTLGVVLPSLCIITVLSYILQKFQSLRPVKYAFYGIRAGVLALLVKAFYTMYKKCPKHLIGYIIMGGAFLASTFLDINVIFIIVACALVGLVTSMVQVGRAKK